MEPHPENESGTKSPLIAHVIFRLDIGGLENGLINLINQTPPGVYRHAIICVTHATEFRKRITASDITIIELNKRPGKGLAVYWRLYRALRKLKPDAVHTRNVNTIEFQPIAALAGVQTRIHGEHGWDVHDLHGTSWKYRVLRKLVRPFIDHFIVVSKGLRDYLITSIRIPPERVTLIYNGVDSKRFRPREMMAGKTERVIATDEGPAVIGTIGRMKEVKNQRLLIQAFTRLVNQLPDGRSKIRLVMVGDGPLRDALMDDLTEANLEELSSFPGACDNIEELLRDIDIFVLPSRNEGISNTILEAMATGLPVIATRVGGTPEIVMDGITGVLTEDDDVSGLVSAAAKYVEDSELRQRHGTAARAHVLAKFSLDAMVARYLDVYRQSLQ
jgi:sugar transferase (PEP-CTERM/EpsH1 system associated)